MSETPRDQRELWREVSRTFEELGEALRVHLSADAARSPSDPTHPPAGGGSPGRPGEGAGASDSDWVGSAHQTESAPWADAARPGESEGFEDPWAAATDEPRRPSAAGADRTTGQSDATAAGAGDAVGPSPSAGTAGSGPTGPGASGSGATGSGTTESGAGAGTTGAGTGAAAGTGTGGTGTGGTGAGTGGAGTSGAGTSGAGTSGAGTSGAGGTHGWREWSGSWGGSGGRFAGPADWDSAREAVQDLGSSLRRIATQAGDAARDPHVHESAQRAARTLGDAIVSTFEGFADELRDHMRTPRGSDRSGPPEPPPVAPIEDNRDYKP